MLAALLLPLAAVAAQQADEAAAGAVLEVYVRDGCPHCAAAKEYLPEFARQHPDLAIVLRPVDRDPAAREDLLRLSRAADAWPPGVPTFAIDGRLLVGFESAAATGPELDALVKQASRLPQRVDTALFGTLSAERLGLPLFTLALGLLDGFNPCAMWVLLLLLSLLVRFRERKRIALVAGTFVFVSGAVYYAFMAAWLNAFLLLGMSPMLRWILAFIALAVGVANIRDFAAPDRDPTLAIPQSAKPGLYARIRRIMEANAMLPALAGAGALAVVVNFVELLCTAGFPAIYTAVLAQHGLDAPAHYAYLLLYIAAYMADDTAMVVVAVMALGSNRLSARTGRWLKLASGLVMAALGTAMIVRPQWFF